jgi:3-oxoacyl-[acyl-carrier-protein] synthase II
VVTACSTGAHAIGDAARLVALGDAEVMVAGGAESPICRISMAGFAACRALATEFNDTPQKASRPYDKDRDGFVMGEGAGIVVLESLEHAKARGAKIYGEVVGYGLSGDAFHITAPSEDGDGAYRCMKAALKRSGLQAGDIDYVNAHGTSTMADTIELGAVERLFGAAGAKLAMRDGMVPPTLNLDNPEVETAIDLVAHKAKKRKVDVALSNSFGFGGTNASVMFKRV